MAVMVILNWPGTTPQQYDQVRELVGWLEDAPTGGRAHTAAFSENGGHFIDVWDSAEAFQAFVDSRLMPAVQQLGIEGQPDVQVLPLHELYVPRPETILAT
jgi:hypothetical protein